MRRLEVQPPTVFERLVIAVAGNLTASDEAVGGRVVDRATRGGFAFAPGETVYLLNLEQMRILEVPAVICEGVVLRVSAPHRESLRYRVRFTMAGGSRTEGWFSVGELSGSRDQAFARAADHWDGRKIETQRVADRFADLAREAIGQINEHRAAWRHVW